MLQRSWSPLSLVGLIRKRWKVREPAGDSPLGRHRVEEWEGWYLFGVWKLHERVRSIHFED